MLQLDCHCAILKGQCASPASADRGALQSLSSKLTPFAFVERLLEAEDPIWYRWNEDVSALINEATRAAHQEFAKSPGGGTDRERHLAYHRRKRLIWLLDRLVPKADRAHFEPFIANGSAVFAWGRRLKPEERHLLIEVAASPASGVWYESSVLAWCDSCPDEEVASLLDWAEPWAPVFKTKRVSPLLVIPEQEFFRRYKDHSLRRSLMCAHLAAAARRFREGGDFDRGVFRGSIHSLLNLLLGDSDAPCPTGPIPDSAENWKTWLNQILTAAAFADVAAGAG